MMSTMLQNVQEFWRASFQVMSENSDSSTTKLRVPLDFKISDKRNGISPPSPSKILNDFLQAGNDLNVSVLRACFRVFKRITFAFINLTSYVDIVFLL